MQVGVLLFEHTQRRSTILVNHLQKRVSVLIKIDVHYWYVSAQNIVPGRVDKRLLRLEADQILVSSKTAGLFCVL